MSSIEIKKMGITNTDCECVVNAANEYLLEGGGVCGDIFKAAGPLLTDACNKIGHCDCGSAVLTDAYNMNARYIIHAVGPVYHDGKHHEDQLLYSAYKQSLKLAKDHNCHSIAFCLISAGIFGYPVDEAWRKALQACMDFFLDHPDYDLRIVFACIDDNVINMGNDVLTELKKSRKYSTLE